MNVTPSLEEDLVEEARTIAAGMGKSLNQLIRDYLRRGGESVSVSAILSPSFAAVEMLTDR